MEFLMFLNIPRTPWTRRVFEIFDTDRSGELDFKEWVLGMWNYCTLARPQPYPPPIGAPDEVDEFPRSTPAL